MVVSDVHFSSEGVNPNDIGISNLRQLARAQFRHEARPVVIGTRPQEACVDCRGLPGIAPLNAPSKVRRGAPG